MQMQYMSEPVAGETFSVEITEAAGASHLSAFVDEQLVYEVQCPDPPCHEAFTVPYGSGGSILRVVAEDASGSRELTLGITIETSQAQPDEQMQGF